MNKKKPGLWGRWGASAGLPLKMTEAAGNAPTSRKLGGRAIVPGTIPACAHAIWRLSATITAYTPLTFRKLLKYKEKRNALISGGLSLACATQ
jgi:hypothetical protein